MKFEVKIMSGGVNKLGHSYEGDLKKIFEKKCVYGYTGQQSYNQNIILEKISHVIEDIKVDDNGNVTGTCRVLDTPNGKILEGLVESGWEYETATAGFGILKDGVVSDYRLNSIDLVNKKV